MLPEQAQREMEEREREREREGEREGGCHGRVVKAAECDSLVQLPGLTVAKHVIT